MFTVESPQPKQASFLSKTEHPTSPVKHIADWLKEAIEKQKQQEKLHTEAEPYKAERPPRIDLNFIQVEKLGDLAKKIREQEDVGIVGDTKEIAKDVSHIYSMLHDGVNIELMAKFREDDQKLESVSFSGTQFAPRNSHIVLSVILSETDLTQALDAINASKTVTLVAPEPESREQYWAK